ncbi:MAG: hypothetical protein ACI9WO_001969 [Sphingobacteriales bacterium]|jgi:hypothetical protein
MSDKFKNIPTDEETQMLSAKEIKIAGYDALHQKWIWDDLNGETLVFSTPDIQALSEKELKDLILENHKIKSPKDMVVNTVEEGFTFVTVNVS